MSERYLPPEAQSFKASDTTKPDIKRSLFDRLRDRTLRRVLAMTLSFGAVAPTANEIFSAPVDKAKTMYSPKTETPKVEFRGQEWDRAEFDTNLLEIMRGQPDLDGNPDLLGNFVDDCSSAEQCFAYYSDQLEEVQTEDGYALIHEGVELMTGKTADEVDWVGEGIRAGLMETTGTGWIKSKSEVGRDKFQGMSGEKRKKFFAEMFARHAETLSRLYREAQIEDRSPDDREAVAKKAGDMIRAETEFHAQTARTWWKADMKGPDFARWFTSGEGHGFASGEAQWEQEFANWQAGIDGLYAHLGNNPIEAKPGDLEKQHTRSANEAKVVYHGMRGELLASLSPRAQESL